MGTVATLALIVSPTHAKTAGKLGYWELSDTYREIAMTGVPASATVKHLGQTHVQRICATAESVGNLMAWGASNEDCSVDRQVLANGRYDLTMFCKRDNSVLRGSGTITPTTITGRMTKDRAGPDGLHISADISGKWIGNCPIERQHHPLP